MRIVFTCPTLKMTGGVAKYVAHTLSCLKRYNEVALFCPYESVDVASRSYACFNKISEVKNFKPDLIQNNGLYDYNLVRELNQLAPVAEFMHIYNECAAGGRYLFRQEKACHKVPGLSCWKSILTRQCIQTNRPWKWLSFWNKSLAFTDWLRECPLVLTNSVYSKSVLDFLNVDVKAILLSLTDELVESEPVYPNEPIRFMFVGRPSAEKGLSHLFRAATQLDGHFEILIKLVSKTKYVTEQLESFKSLNIKSQEVLNYNEAHIVVMPSLFPEPFGLVGLEAYNHSRPVIAYDSGGIKEWHGGDATGKLIPASNIESLSQAMNTYIKHPELIEVHGKNGHAHMKNHFSPEKHSNKLYQVYVDFLKSI